MPDEGLPGPLRPAILPTPKAHRLWELLHEAEASQWRDPDSYAFFDALSVEGLAWECLRRCEDYYRQYHELVSAGAEAAPLNLDAQRRWGLRFPGPARPVRPVADCTWTRPRTLPWSPLSPPRISCRRPGLRHWKAPAYTVKVPKDVTLSMTVLPPRSLSFVLARNPAVS